MYMSAWLVNNNKLVKDMINGALGLKKGWKKLEFTEHYRYLKDLIDITHEKSICDLGCGSGELGRTLRDYKYIGFDLPHIVDQVAKFVNPDLTYHHFDAYNYDYTQLKNHKLIICNSFISELTNPIEILEKIIENTSNYLIIHRQEFTNDKTRLSLYKTYGDIDTTRSHISKDDFAKLLTYHCIIKEFDYNGLKSILVQKISEKKIHIIQNGSDGFGHQMHGLISCLALHGVNNYYFDGQYFINKKFSFDHIDKNNSKDVIDYIKTSVQLFIEINGQGIRKYNNIIHSHEIYNIPDNYDINTLYSVDNAYYFNRIPINKNEKMLHINNIEKYKHCFVNEKLPKNRLDKNNIVIHFRLGDAMVGRFDSINNYNKLLLELLNILILKYENYKYYLHTDGNINFFTKHLDKKNIDYKLFKTSENVLNVLSDFINAQIFICSNSSLSQMSTFLGNHELLIIPDDTNVSMPNNALTITNYIMENKKNI